MRQGGSARWRRVGFFAVAMVVTLAAPAAAQVGFAPPAVDVDDALRGEQVVASINLLNGASDPIVFTLKADGEMAGWIRFGDLEEEPIESLRVEPESAGYFLVLIDIPADASNEIHEGTIRATTQASEAEGGGGDEIGANVKVSASIPVRVNVTGTQVLEATLINFEAGDSEVGLPMTFFALIANQGNVTITPSVAVDISQGGSLVGSAVVDDQPIRPGEQRQVHGTWDTTDAKTGQYAATATASVGDLDLGVREDAFELAPRGTLTRHGSITGVVVANEPEAGGVAQVHVGLVNEGTVEARPTVRALLHDADGTLINTSTSEPIFMFPKESRETDLFIDVPAAGIHRLEVTANFEGTETDPVTYEFEVKAAGGIAAADSEESSSLPVAVVAIAIAAAVGVIAAIVFARTRKSPRAAEPSPEEQPAGAP